MSTYLYVRNSVGKPCGGEAQHEALLAHAAKLGLTDIKTLDFTGARDETAIQMLLTHVSRGDKVLACSADRLARSEADRAALLENLQKRGVEVLSLSAPAANLANAAPELLNLVVALYHTSEHSADDLEPETIALLQATGEFLDGLKIIYPSPDEAYRAVIAKGATPNP
jgi:hypothetical protein